MRLCSLILIVWGSAGLVPSLEAQPPDQEESAPLWRIVISSKKPAGSASSLIVSYGLTRDDFRRVEMLDGIETSLPVREARHKARFGEQSETVLITGTTPGYADVHSLPVQSGRFLREKDVAQLNNIAVLNQQAADLLFPTGKPIGENVGIGKHYFLIVGVIAAGEDNQRKRPEPPRIFVPISTMRSRMGDETIVREQGSIAGERYELSRIVLDVPGPRAERIAEEIRRLLSRSHETEDFEVQISKGE